MSEWLSWDANVSGAWCLKPFLDCRSKSKIWNQAGVRKALVSHWRSLMSSLKPTTYGFPFICKTICCYMWILHHILQTNFWLWLILDYNSLIIPFSLTFALMALTCVMGHMKYWGGPWFLRLLFSFDTSLSSIFNSSCSCLSLLNASIDKLYLYWSFLIIFSSSSLVLLSAFSVSFLHFNSLIYTFSDCLAYILVKRYS